MFFVSELDNDSIRNDMEEKKRYLLRKLSFRPTVDELRNRKVSKTILLDLKLHRAGSDTEPDL